MLTYILVVSRGYILLISICSMSKIEKLEHYIVYLLLLAIPAILFKNYFKGAKIWWLLAQLYKNSTDCFVLEFLTVGTVSKFQNRKNLYYRKPGERK